jgi:predicted ATPase
MGKTRQRLGVIRTPDQRLRVFISSTLGELSEERNAARDGIERLRLSPVMFELGARPHPPRELYRAYLEQSHVFVGIYWERYGWVAPGEEISGLEDEYRLSSELPRLIYIKEPAPEREARLDGLLKRVKSDDRTSYKRFAHADELADLVENDLAVLLAERFETTAGINRGGSAPLSAPPVPLTETVGRGEDVAAVAAQLEEGTRLLTLTGPGGVGKTRVALEVARRAKDSYPGGVHFVPLAPITDPELVLYTVADRLGIAVEGARQPQDAIADGVAGRTTLLVLDNFEQVASAGAELASLLERCPELQVLATSRQALRVRGERDVPVAPLPLPDPDLALSSLEQQPVVRLFVERARDVSAGFSLDESNAAAVVELCRRLDGLPLAIELAAARTRVLSPQALLDRLGARFDALGEGRIDLPERQRTLRAAIDWSHDLLDDRERALFARLRVFAGGFPLAAAESVCRAEGEEDVLGTLASLLEKSLIVVAGDPIEGEPRFQMLEIVRAYATERLRERGETEVMRQRHLDWYRDLSDRAQPFLCGPGQRDWAARFDPERANCVPRCRRRCGSGTTRPSSSWSGT